MRITEDKLKNDCKLGQGPVCCRYLIGGERGFECAKLLSLKEYLDGRVAAGTINAQGDNCEGVDNYETNQM